MIEPLVRHAMCALMPRTEALPGVVDTDVAGFVHRMRRESTWIFWLGILGGTFVFVVTPLMTIGWPLPSFALSAARLDRHAHGIATTRVYLFRQAVFLLKTAAGMCWGSDPAIRRRFALEPYADEPVKWRA